MPVLVAVVDVIFMKVIFPPSLLTFARRHVLLSTSVTSQDYLQLTYTETSATKMLHTKEQQQHRVYNQQSPNQNTKYKCHNTHRANTDV